MENLRFWIRHQELFHSAGYTGQVELPMQVTLALLHPAGCISETTTVIQLQCTIYTSSKGKFILDLSFPPVLCLLFSHGLVSFPFFTSVSLSHDDWLQPSHFPTREPLPRIKMLSGFAATFTGSYKVISSSGTLKGSDYTK